MEVFWPTFMFDVPVIHKMSLPRHIETDSTLLNNITK